MDLDGVLKWNALSQEDALLRNLQANILAPHWHDHGCCLFLQFAAPPTDQDAIKFRHAMATQVKTAKAELEEIDRYRKDRTPGSNTTCFYLTAAGFKVLRMPEEQIPLHDKAFAAGLSKRNEVFQLDEQDLNEWETYFRPDKGSTIHAMFFIATDDVNNMRGAVQQFRANLPPWVSVIREEPLQLRRHRVTDLPLEHFGFVDGISGPVFVLPDRAAGDNERWFPERFGLSLVLTTRPSISRRPPNTSDVIGSYLVVLKLEQHVARFNEQVQKLAAALTASGQAVDLEGAAALVIGRLKTGRPLVDVGPGGDRNMPRNDFDLVRDHAGKKCPLHAHIRKVNPRGLGGLMREELAHQIVRRGMTYGPHDPGDPGAPAEDHGSGLLFMCFQSSIEAQFEHIFKNWVNDPAFSRSRTGRDALIGQGPSEMQQWPRKDGNFVPFAFERCVTLKGGEYFFAPLKSALAAQS